MNLSEFFIQHPKAAIAFSGGVDSAYLLYAAHLARADVAAYYVKSVFQPRFELEDAKKLCALLDIPLHIIPLDILRCAEITANSAERCYHCKRAIFSAIADAAKADGYALLLDGTNASDAASERPGMRALRELSVRSPLRECGLTKAEIRRRSREARLFTWDKPAYACLATRIPTGDAITAEKLRAAEQAEEFLFSLGFSDFRVRRMGDSARLQFPESQLGKALEKRECILNELKKYYASVLLDLEVR